ncbi:Z1 domain-containing protein [Terrabacter sp. Soil811]|uniref:Z1 domain-containing protein n=1 Tax=Terrabacter sp. Soil811 TaxID=1736419 RepID=UPI000A637C7B|nr:Z1 domain-containing protein [Terrabacter sp. Soil811]
MNASKPSHEDIQMCKRTILGEVTVGRIPLEQARRQVKRVMRPELVDAAYDEILLEMATNLSVDSAVTNSETYSAPGAAWYHPSTVGPCWAHYLSKLTAARSPALGELDRQTREIVALLANPNAPGSRRKGLVMGSVQSGKTRNFAGVAAKAADAGYKMIIVLAGMHDNLRDQTQARLDEQLFDGARWYSLTAAGQDYEEIPGPEQVLENMPVVVAVVKKNTHRLARLVRTLKDVSPQARRRFPILIIDDEADQATPNSKAQQARISAINGRLRDLWGLVETGSYLAYTATPFANVLIDPDESKDLFPSDFIKTIPPGDGYFGAERVFGLSETVDEQGNGAEGLDMVRPIKASDALSLRAPSDRDARQVFDPEAPESLVEAFRWFVVATAIRRARGQAGHSSMLVHTTHYTDPHAALQARLDDLVNRSLEEVRDGDMSGYVKSWKEEATRVASEATVPLPSWQQVAAEIEGVLASVDVIVDNGRSDDRLNYNDDHPRTVIAVGGGTLSRGLTLEGLVVSYFTRTSNAYDTLLQMGRWFGYRPKYEDLPRVWVTEGLDDDYAFLARVELDLRSEIESVQGSEFTPAQIGVRIRAHPGRLQVTAANKMWAANVVQLGLSETSNQTFILRANDAQHNVGVVEELLAGLELDPVPWQNHRYMARGISGSRVSAFLDGFAVHPDQHWLHDPENLSNIQQWISANAAGHSWDVVIAANSRLLAVDGATPLGSLRLAGLDLPCLNRAPLSGSSAERLDFKAIASPSDRIADIDPEDYGDSPKSDDAQRRRIRRTHAGGQGLLVIYPLSGQSKAAPPPAGERAWRMDMPVHDPMLGFAIFFPAVNDATGDQGTFVSVRTTWEVPDTAEGDEDDAIETEEGAA